VTIIVKPFPAMTVASAVVAGLGPAAFVATTEKLYGI
jgi:hypothetical protein